MDPLSLISAGTSLLGGLFGKKRRNPYAGQQAQAYGRLGQQGARYGQMAQQAQGGLDRYDPQYRQGVDEYADYLRRDPYTDQRSTAALSQATAGSAAAYQSAQARLQASLAGRGMESSSLASGGLAGIEAGRAATMAGAQNDLAFRKIDEEGQRKQMLLQLLSGARGRYQGEAMNAMGAQGDLDSRLAGLLTGESRYTDARNDQGEQDQFGLLAGLAEMLARGRKKPGSSRGGGSGPFDWERSAQQWERTS